VPNSISILPLDSLSPITYGGVWSKVFRYSC